MPAYMPTADLALCPMSEDVMPAAYRMAEDLREAGVRVANNMTGKKIGDQLKWADKSKIPFAIVIGADEIASQKFSVKNLVSGETKECSQEEISGFIRDAK